jgi:hypothetical protein
MTGCFAQRLLADDRLLKLTSSSKYYVMLQKLKTLSWKIMPQTMKAAVVHQFGQPLTLEEVAIPEPGAGQVLMKVVASYRSRIDRRNASGFA